MAWSGGLPAGNHPGDEQLLEYYDGATAEAEARPIADHVTGCARCRQQLREYGAMFRLLGSLPQYEIPRSFALDDLSARRRAPSLWPAFASLAASLLLMIGMLSALTSLDGARTSPSGQNSASVQTAGGASESGPARESSAAQSGAQLDEAGSTVPSGAGLGATTAASTFATPAQEWLRDMDAGTAPATGDVSIASAPTSGGGATDASTEAPVSHTIQERTSQARTPPCAASPPQPIGTVGSAAAQTSAGGNDATTAGAPAATSGDVAAATTASVGAAASNQAAPTHMPAPGSADQPESTVPTEGVALPSPTAAPGANVYGMTPTVALATPTRAIMSQVETQDNGPEQTAESTPLVREDTGSRRLAWWLGGLSVIFLALSGFLFMRRRNDMRVRE